MHLGVVPLGHEIIPLPSQSGRVTLLPLELEDEEEVVEVSQTVVGEPEETQETISEQEFEFASGQQIVPPPAKHLIQVPV